MWNKKWVVGNWKMNGRLQNNDMLLHELRNLPPQQNVCIGIAPPAVYLQQVRQALQSVTNNSVRTCAQDVSRFPGSGAYTGEVSAEMLKDIGVNIVLIGTTLCGLLSRELLEGHWGDLHLYIDTIK